MSRKTETLRRNRRWTGRLARCSAAAFGAGLMLPAGAVAASGGGWQAVTGLQLLHHAALALFPVGMFATILAPLGLQAVIAPSRRAAWAAAAGLLGLALLGPVLGTRGAVAGAPLAWPAAAALMAGAGAIVPSRVMRPGSGGRP